MSIPLPVLDNWWVIFGDDSSFHSDSRLLVTLILVTDPKVYILSDAFTDNRNSSTRSMQIQVRRTKFPLFDGSSYGHVAFDTTCSFLPGAWIFDKAFTEVSNNHAFTWHQLMNTRIRNGFLEMNSSKRIPATSQNYPFHLSLCPSISFRIQNGAPFMVNPYCYSY